MEKLPPITPLAGSRDLQRSSGERSLKTRPLLTKMPPVANRTTDIEIPRAAWSSWKESGKARQLRRPLTVCEVRALEDRRDELAPTVAPYDPREADRVALTLTDMYGGYPSMGSRGDQSVAGRVEAVRRTVAAFPCWAIEKACQSIHANGVWRDGAYDRKWPPTDAEIVDAVREAARLYTDSYRSAVNLLAAEVEEDHYFHATKAAAE